MVDIDDDAVEEALEILEDGMKHAKTAHEHDEIRPTTMMMGKDIKSAYRTLVKAHPDYKLSEGDDA